MASNSSELAESMQLFADDDQDSFQNAPHTPQSFSDYPHGMSPGGFSESSGYDTRSLSPEQQNAFSVPSPSSSVDQKDADAKPVKKRKSWGQQLPIPTTNLPPRKRAKTAEEKEQRRVERVLRNRAAAQKSREIKKQQLEAIESDRDTLVNKCTTLENKMNDYEETIRKLREELQTFKDHHRSCHVAEGYSHNIPSPASTASVKEEPEAMSPQLISDDFDSTVADMFSTPESCTFHIDPQQLQSSEQPVIDFDTFLPPSPSPDKTRQPAALMCDLLCLQGNPLHVLLWIVYAMICWVASLHTSMTTCSPTTMAHRIPMTPKKSTCPPKQSSRRKLFLMTSFISKIRSLT